MRTASEVSEHSSTDFSLWATKISHTSGSVHRPQNEMGDYSDKLRMRARARSDVRNKKSLINDYKEDGGNCSEEEGRGAKPQEHQRAHGAATQPKMCGVSGPGHHVRRHDDISLRVHPVQRSSVSPACQGRATRAGGPVDVCPCRPVPIKAVA